MTEKKKKNWLHIKQVGIDVIFKCPEPWQFILQALQQIRRLFAVDQLKRAKFIQLLWWGCYLSQSYWIAQTCKFQQLHLRGKLSMFWIKLWEKKIKSCSLSPRCELQLLSCLECLTRGLCSRGHIAWKLTNPHVFLHSYHNCIQCVRYQGLKRCTVMWKKKNLKACAQAEILDRYFYHCPLCVTSSHC